MAKAAAQLWLQLSFEVLDLTCPSATPQKIISGGRIPQDPVSRVAKLLLLATRRTTQVLGTNLGNTES